MTGGQAFNPRGRSLVCERCGSPGARITEHTEPRTYRVLRTALCARCRDKTRTGQPTDELAPHEPRSSPAA